MKKIMFAATASLALLAASSSARAGDIGDGLMNAVLGIAVDQLTAGITGQNRMQPSYAPQPTYVPRQMAPSYGAGVTPSLTRNEYTVLSQRYGTYKVDVCMRDRGCLQTLTGVLNNGDRIAAADLDRFFSRIR